MGFILSASTLTLQAKLTPQGRAKLVSSNNSLITSFCLGDSDANYNIDIPLLTGQIPSEGGQIGPNSSVSNSTSSNVGIKSFLIVNGTGMLQKPVELQSSTIITQIQSNGAYTLSGNSLSTNLINRNVPSDPLVNLFYSFGLPTTNAQAITLYTGTTSANGGFSNTALSSLGNAKILAIGIPNDSYGEMLDGKEISLKIVTTGATYTIYSTFQNTGILPATQDTNYADPASNTQFIDNNIAFLFSDDIQPPNNDVTLSWATGFGSVKPFSNNGKQFYNLTSNSSLNKIADKCVGVAYLNKGFLVITDQTIVEAFTTGTTSSVIYNSISTSVMQNITCIAGRGEFGASTNPTFTPGDIPLISEIGLYDALGNLIAFGKTDRHLAKGVNQFLALSVSITL